MSEKNLLLKTLVVIAISSLPIVGLVKWPSDSHSSSGPSVKYRSTTGRELFLNNCARCHGDDAKGDKGPDLTSPKRQTKWAASEEPLISKINKGGLFMPKFGKKLTPEQIKEIAD